jgi:hypothetical protein
MNTISNRTRSLLLIGASLFALTSQTADASPARANAQAISKENRITKREQAARERKVPLSDATTAWSYYGVSPESPDSKRLCYALYPEPVDLNRTEKHATAPAELWVCHIDGSEHRKLFTGNSSVHNGMRQSWVDNKRIVFTSDKSIYVINADTGKIDFGPYEGFSSSHFPHNGKILMYQSEDYTMPKGLYQLDTATGKMPLIIPYQGTIGHVQYSPDGKQALFTTESNSNLVVAKLADGSYKKLPDNKPMHFQWFDNESIFGYVHPGVVGVNAKTHHHQEMYRWDLDGNIIEHLSGHGCHGAARSDNQYFAGETWYFNKNIKLLLYRRGQSRKLVEIFSHNFERVTWHNGGRHHVNPAFSRDGTRLYYKKAVNTNTSHAFYYDLKDVVAPLK